MEFFCYKPKNPEIFPISQLDYLHSPKGNEEQMTKVQVFEKLWDIGIDHQFQTPESTDVTSGGISWIPIFYDIKYYR